MSFRFRHSTTPEPPYSGYLKLLTSVRTHKRYISISNTALTYGHRPDNILWTADLTQCDVKSSSNTICITIPNGKKVRLRLSKPEMQAWLPRIMTSVLGVNSFYCVGARLGSVGGWPLFSGCDRELGDDIRVWSVGKDDVTKCCCLAERDCKVLNLCDGVDRALGVIDLCKDCTGFHVVTQVFRGNELDAIFEGIENDCWRGIVKDVLTVLAALHESGLAHGGVGDAIVVDDSRAWMMVYGYAHSATREDILFDAKDLAAILRKACVTGLGRVVELLEKGVPVTEVLKEPCFRDSHLIDFDALDHHTNMRKVAIDSPRSVLQSGNVL